MSPLRVAGWLTGLTLNAWLLAIVLGGLSGNPDAVDKVDWKLDLSAPAGSGANRQPIDAYRQILTRPLFFKSREPFVPPPPPPPPPPVQTAAPPPVVVDPGVALGGIMIKDNVRKIYVFGKAGTGGAWTSEGDEFMGWKVTSISGAGTRLEQNGRAIDLQLYPGK